MSILIDASPTADRGSSMILNRLLNAWLVFILVHSLFAWFGSRFIVGHDSQNQLCLDGGHRWYLIDRHRKDADSGELLAYRSDQRMAPEIPEGTLVVKRIEGVSGDAVDVETRGIRIQGLIHPLGYPHREKLDHRALHLGSHLIVPEGGYWVMGDHPRSFDSRYFGPIEERQMVGVAHALPF